LTGLLLLLLAASAALAPRLLAAAAGTYTVEDRLRQFGPAVRSRLAADFSRTGVPYPPRRVILVGLKRERMLEVWVSNAVGPWRWLRTYPILAASGKPGPKLRRGDLQVPEGLYRIESLNPNSRFHLALRANYPNAADRQRARTDGRTDLGGDIMIHGRAVSTGCLAMGDEAAEDLFVLTAETGIASLSVILSPVDFRVRDLPRDMPPLPAWTAELYREIRAALAPLRP
jgi:hypothetical protein